MFEAFNQSFETDFSSLEIFSFSTMQTRLKCNCTQEKPFFHKILLLQLMENTGHKRGETMKSFKQLTTAAELTNVNM